MNTIEDELPFILKTMKLIALTVGPDCEVVLHDWSKGYDQSIIAIENGHVTQRHVGECGSNLGLEIMRGTIKDGDRFNYFTKTRSGKTLKSSTIFLTNDSGETLGALCINLDISNYLTFRDTLNAFIESDPEQPLETVNEGDEFFANNVGELTDYLLTKGLSLVGKPVDQLTRDDKLKIIDYLDEKGLFLITKSGDKVCHFLDISKFTLYNYLDTVRAEKADKKS